MAGRFLEPYDAGSLHFCLYTARIHHHALQWSPLDEPQNSHMCKAIASRGATVALNVPLDTVYLKTVELNTLGVLGRGYVVPLHGGLAAPVTSCIISQYLPSGKLVLNEVPQFEFSLLMATKPAVPATMGWAPHKVITRRETYHDQKQFYCSMRRSNWSLWTNQPCCGS